MMCGFVAADSMRPTRYPASFWLNVATTMLIPLGPAVEDSDSGKDVYAALVVRTGVGGVQVQGVERDATDRQGPPCGACQLLCQGAA